MHFPSFQKSQRPQQNASLTRSVSQQASLATPEHSGLSTLEFNEPSETVSLSIDLPRFQKHFARKVEQRTGRINECFKTDQFLAAFRAAENTVSGLAIQVGLETMRELVTASDLSNFDSEVRNTMGGEVVGTQKAGQLNICRVADAKKPGSSSPLAIYLADSGLSNIERTFIEGHELSHSRHGDSVSAVALGALSQSLENSGANPQELSDFRALERSINHEQELRSDRDGLELLLREGYDASAIFQELSQSSLISLSPAATATHPSDTARKAQIAELLGQGRRHSPFPSFT